MPEAFPDFWTGLEALVRETRVRAIEPVRWELEKSHDGLLKWARRQPEFFVPLLHPIQESMKEIITDFPKLADNRRDRSMADPFVIAHARVDGRVVVTQEGHGTEKRPQIPMVCKRYGVRSISLQQLILEEGWVFRKG